MAGFGERPDGLDLADAGPKWPKAAPNQLKNAPPSPDAVNDAAAAVTELPIGQKAMVGPVVTPMGPAVGPVVSRMEGPIPTAPTAPATGGDSAPFRGHIGEVN